MKYFYLITAFLVGLSCNTHQAQTANVQATSKPKISQDSIIKLSLELGAWKHPLYSMEWQNEIDKGLALDSTIAYLWQQKAMPLFKQDKCEVGMPFLDKAVIYDPQNYLDYRGFIKCIFAKTYRAAIQDFEECKLKFGNRIVMDHSYNFYIGLCLLQLNEFEKAEHIFDMDIADWQSKHGKDWIHYLDLFYYGISKYELKKYDEAIVLFDEAILKYPRFADAEYYKAYCLNELGKKEEATALFDLAHAHGLEGQSINEDNAIYVRYPYQLRWMK